MNITLEKIRDELILVSQKVKKGEITPNVGNAIVNALRSATYVEQVIQQSKGLEIKLEQNGITELSQADREKLDAVVKLLSDKEVVKNDKSKS